MKIVTINKSNLLLVSLALLGCIFLIIGWSGLPQKYMGNNRENASPPATRIETEQQKNAAENEKIEAGKETANIEEPLDRPLSVDRDSGYFINYRLERQRIRGRRLETLKGIVNSPNSTEEDRSKAQQEIMEISRKIARENQLENLIRAKGFDDVLVFWEKEGVSVVVKEKNMTPEEAARICDLVTRGTGISQQDVVIIPKKG